MRSHTPRRLNRPVRLLALCGAIAGVVWFPARASAQDAPPPKPHDAPATRPARPPETIDTLTGTIDGYNLSPRGGAESLMLKTGDNRVAQVNFPPDVGAVVQQSAAVGDQVKVDAVPELSMPDHPIYRLKTFTPAKGNPITVASPDDEQQAHVEGTIARLNYGHRGEVNGAVLDTGDFVHFGPEGADELKLGVGQKITADGMARPMLGGHNAIDADKVNDTRLEHRGPRGGGGGPGRFFGAFGPRGRGGPFGPGGPGGFGGPGGRGMRDGGPGGPGGAFGPRRRGPGGPTGRGPGGPGGGDGPDGADIWGPPDGGPGGPGGFGPHDRGPRGGGDDGPPPPPRSDDRGPGGPRADTTPPGPDAGQ